MDLSTLAQETGMGENKGHGVKGPRHDDVDDLSINTASGKIANGGQQQSGNMHPGQQQDSMQSGQQGNRQSGQGQQQGSQQQGQQQQGSQQSGQQGQQQQGSQQHGGQHASGGTPALDDLGSRQGESAKDASQAFSQDNSIDKQRGNR